MNRYVCRCLQLHLLKKRQMWTGSEPRGSTFHSSETSSARKPPASSGGADGRGGGFASYVGLVARARWCGEDATWPRSPEEETI